MTLFHTKHQWNVSAADQTSADYFKAACLHPCSLPSPLPLPAPLLRLSLALCLDHLKSLTPKLITEINRKTQPTSRRQTLSDMSSSNSNICRFCRDICPPLWAQQTTAEGFKRPSMLGLCQLLLDFSFQLAG